MVGRGGERFFERTRVVVGLGHSGSIEDILAVALPLYQAALGKAIEDRLDRGVGPLLVGRKLASYILDADLSVEPPEGLHHFELQLALELNDR